MRIGWMGAGKFDAMYLAQFPRTLGVHLVTIADVLPDAARATLARVGWNPVATGAPSAEAALQNGNSWIADDWQAVAIHPQIDVVVECTGHPVAAVEHCLAAFAHGKHVVNVTVEAGTFCGPLLARQAQEAGVVSSLALGDQPALICGLVDWARICGFPVVAAGRGHECLPLGVARQVKVIRPVKKGQSLSGADVQMDTITPAYHAQHEMAKLLAAPLIRVAGSGAGSGTS